jgi:hypothetical protein
MNIKTQNKFFHFEMNWVGYVILLNRVMSYYETPNSFAG